MVDFSFRQANMDDLDAVLALCRACVEKGNTHWTQEYPDEEIVKADIVSGCQYVLMAQGELVGIVAILPTDDIEDMGLPFACGHAYVLSRLGVAPLWQGRHISTEILRLANEQGKRLGYQACHLLCAKENPVTNALYQHAGFQSIASVYEYGHDFIAYEKRL